MNLKLLRKKVGLSQKEVAERIGVSQVYISKIEKGDVNGLTFLKFKKLAKVYKIDKLELFKILLETETTLKK